MQLTSLRNSDGDETLAAEHQAKLEAKLDAYESILSKFKYLAGDVSNIAEIICRSTHYLFLQGPDAGRPLSSSTRKLGLYSNKA